MNDNALCASVTTGTVISGFLLSLFGSDQRCPPPFLPTPAAVYYCKNRLHQIGGIVLLVEIFQRLLTGLPGLSLKVSRLPPENFERGVPG